MIKCLLLNNGTVLVSEIDDQVPADVGEPDCKLIKPYQLKKNIDGKYDSLVDWIDFSDQKELMIHSHNILTIVDPSVEILKLYLETKK